MKLTEGDRGIMRFAQTNKKAWIFFMEAVIRDACDIEKLDEGSFKAAQLMAAAIRKYLIEPVRLSEPPRSIGEQHKPEDEDFG